MDVEPTDDICLPPIENEVVPSSTSKRNIEISVDEALQESGLGRFQYLSFLLLGIIQICFGYTIVLSYFLNYDPPWKCIRNDTSEFCMKNFGVEFEAGNKMFTARCNLGRNEWTYSTHKEYSVVTEFDLVCGKTALSAFVGSVFHIGGAIGFFISAFAADYYGRKYVLVVSLCIVTISSLACSYASNIAMLIVLRAFVGGGYNSSYSISYVYLTETVPPKYRMLVGVGYCLMFVFSELLIDTVAYFCRYWRRIVLYSSLPTIIGIMAIFVLPESPRWLSVNDKKHEAEMTLARIANFNKKPLGPFSIKSSTMSEKYTYKHLFQNRKVGVLTLSLCLLWFTIAMVYYTIAFESSSLGGDMYKAFAFTTLAEIPSKFVSYYVYDHFGRKTSILISLVATCAFATSTTIIPTSFAHRYILNIVLMIFARFFADINIQGIYLWSSEIFPTVLRLQGLGICTVFERAGTFASPFLTNVLLPINRYLPHIILICFLVLSTVIGGVVLPETNKQPTRERYEDFFSKPDCEEERHRA